jgi:hypothetical protein
MLLAESTRLLSLSDQLRFVTGTIWNWLWCYRTSGGWLNSQGTRLSTISFSNSHVVNRLCKHWFHFKWNKSRGTRRFQDISPAQSGSNPDSRCACTRVSKRLRELHSVGLQSFNYSLGHSRINRQAIVQDRFQSVDMASEIINEQRSRTSGSTWKRLTELTVRLNRSFCQISPRHTQVITVQPKHSINFARGTWSTGNLAHQPVGWLDPRSSSLQQAWLTLYDPKNAAWIGCYLKSRIVNCPTCLFTSEGNIWVDMNFSCLPLKEANDVFLLYTCWHFEMKN